MHGSQSRRPIRSSKSSPKQILWTPRNKTQVPAPRNSVLSKTSPFTSDLKPNLYNSLWYTDVISLYDQICTKKQLRVLKIGNVRLKHKPG